MLNSINRDKCRLININIIINIIFNFNLMSNFIQTRDHWLCDQRWTNERMIFGVVIFFFRMKPLKMNEINIYRFYNLSKGSTDFLVFTWNYWNLSIYSNYEYVFISLQVWTLCLIFFKSDRFIYYKYLTSTHIYCLIIITYTYLLILN